MPTYEYKCDDCKIVLDIKKSMFSPHPRYCTNCGAKCLRRVFSPLAFSVTGDFHRKTEQFEPSEGTEIRPRKS